MGIEQNPNTTRTHVFSQTSQTELTRTVPTDRTRTEPNCETSRTEHNLNFTQWVRFPSLLAASCCHIANDFTTDEQTNRKIDQQKKEDHRQHVKCCIWTFESLIANLHSAVVPFRCRVRIHCTSQARRRRFWHATHDCVAPYVDIILHTGRF